MEQLNGRLTSAFEEEQKRRVFSVLREYFHQNLFCDISLVIGDHTLRAHKLVLAASSKFFANAFDKNPSLSTIDLERELQPHGVEVSFDDIRLILDILYCVGTVEIPPEKKEFLLLLAQIMGIPTLIGFLKTPSGQKRSSTFQQVLTMIYQLKDTLCC